MANHILQHDLESPLTLVPIPFLSLLNIVYITFEKEIQGLPYKNGKDWCADTAIPRPKLELRVVAGIRKIYWNCECSDKDVILLCNCYCKNSKPMVLLNGLPLVL